MKLALHKIRKAGFISLIIIMGVIQSNEMVGQSATKPIQIKGADFVWAINHPFIAIKAKRITKEALRVTDSLEQAGVFTDGSGGQLDAFKHAYWMALLAQDISVNKVRKLGEAHERANVKQSKKSGVPFDSVASKMDLWNNEIGLNIGIEYYGCIRIQLIDEVINAVQNGDMKVINKNSGGVFLDCDDQVIDTLHLKTWRQHKCLRPSNYQYN